MAALKYALELGYAEYEEAVIEHTTLAGELRAILDRSLEIMKRRPAITDFFLRGNVDWSHPDLRRIRTRLPARVVRFNCALVVRAVERGEIAASEGPLVERLLVTLRWGLSHAGRDSDEAGAMAAEGLKRLVDGTLLNPRGR